MVAMCASPSFSGQNVLWTGLAGLGGARQPEPAGAAELLQAVRPDELFERIDLLGRADELEDDRVGTDVGRARAHCIGERHQLGPLVRGRRDLDQRQLALDGLAGDELLHAQDVDELVHLLLDLLERRALAVDADRDPRDVVTLGRADRERVDVEAAPREQRRDAHQRARLVLDEDTQRVLHAFTSATASSNATTSSAAAPAGIIGKQCSRGSTRASITQTRPEARDCSSASRSSSSVSAVNPTPPYACASIA